MIRLNKLFVLLAFGVFVVSCADTKTPDADGFVDVEKITADSTQINEILEPSEAILTEDYALIVSRKSNKLLYRYSLPDWEFVDTTFDKGQGPADMLRPIFQPTNTKTKDKVWISDPDKGELRILRADKDSVRAVSTISVKDSKNNSIWYATIVNDRHLLDTKIDYRGTQREQLFSYDIKDSLRSVDSLLTLSAWEIKIYGENSMAMGKITGTVITHGDKLFYFYPELNSMMLYSISPEGKFSYIKTLGKEYTYEQVAAMEATYLKGEWVDAIEVTDKYIYYSYNKFEEVPDPQDPKNTKTNYLQSEIRVYDHDLNPVKKFILHNPLINKILVDEGRSKFYAWSGSMDFEQVYIYDYKL